MSRNHSQPVEWVAPQTDELIDDTSETVELVDPDDVAAALGARRSGIALDETQSPMTLIALRQRIFSDIVSTGGRPSLKGETTQKKIRIRSQDWKLLEKVADELSTEDRKVTPTHLAGVLVSQAVAAISTKTGRQRAEKSKAGRRKKSK